MKNSLLSGTFSAVSVKVVLGEIHVSTRKQQTKKATSQCKHWTGDGVKLGKNVCLKQPWKCE